MTAAMRDAARVPCPTCGERASIGCRWPNGYPRKTPHLARIRASAPTDTTNPAPTPQRGTQAAGRPLSEPLRPKDEQ